MKPKFATVFAELYLKVNEEEKAFPYIEQLSKTNPRKAKDLAEEFVRDLDQKPRPELAATAPQPILLRLRVRQPGRGHPADPLQAGAEPRGAGGWIKRLRQAAHRRDR